MANLFYDALQVLDYMHDALDFHSEELGFAFVGYGEEELRPDYPAVVVHAGPVARSLHATHTFQIEFVLELWVYHANLNQSHRVRTREDLQLVGKVRDFLHTQKNMTMADANGSRQIIQGWVSAEDPAVIRRPTGTQVVGSRIEWTGISQERFPKEG